LLLSGASQAFFTPLLAALALALVGHDHLSRMIGPNRVWNNVGHIVAAISAMIIVSTLGTASIFAGVFVVSLLAAASCALIRPDELARHRHRAPESPASASERPRGDSVNWKALFTDKRVILLIVSTALFQLSNAPVIPLVALYIKSLHGSDELIGALVLVAQTAMIPFVLLSGRLCERWGRRPLFAIGFLVMPVRILLCSLTDQPHVLVAIQSLEGIGAGIECVVVASICADLTREHGGFNALIGLVATPLGGVLGPLLTGVLVQHFGFVASFRVFAVIATVGAAVFICFMPETLPGRKADS
jgi:predicted MFS family arabinose efflux permease